MCTRSFTSWSPKREAATRSRRSGSRRQHFCAGHPSLSTAAGHRSTRSMKRAGLVLDCSARLMALGINCHVVCPQKLDEQNRRVKTDGLDAKALCLKLDRFVQGNRSALALVRVPTEEEEQKRAIHRQREQLVKARKQLEAQGRSLMVNHGIEPVKNWWSRNGGIAVLQVPQGMK